MRLVSRAIPLFLFAASAWAGGGPQNVLVVVNDNSLESMELGQYYQDQRGIPEKNICHIRVSTNYNIDAAGFTNTIRQPIADYIGTAGLSNQIDYIVFSRDIPYRVYMGNSSNGLTSVMFYNMRTSAPPCSLPPSTKQDYYESERAFTRSGPPNTNRYYISSILTATNLLHAEQMIDRAVAADCTQPTGSVYLFHTLDERNIQWFQFENTAFLLRFLAAPLETVFKDGAFFWPVTNAAGVMVGQPGGNGVDSMQFTQSTYSAGAIAHHLTSFGGVLYELSGQESIIRWLDAGCIGSYGTVMEPCSYSNKFPQARIQFWYGRGFNMGESYWMSVQSPYQGVVVGDPLCAPYAYRPAVAVSGLASNQVVSGTVALSVTGTTSGVGRPVDQLDLFLDGMRLATLTNLPPTRSNTVTVTLSLTNNRSYTVPINADVFVVATGLTAAINAAPDLGVTAKARGDRIEIVQDAIGAPGTSYTCVASSSSGSASRLTVFARSPFTSFLETTYRAHEQVTLSGTPVSGDVVRAVVTRLDGLTFTNAVVAETNDTALSLLTNLAIAVNGDTNLEDASGCDMTWVAYNANIDQYEGYFRSRTNTWEGENLVLAYAVSNQPGSTLTGPGFTDNFNDNSNVLAARAMIFLSEGLDTLDSPYDLNTAALADGPHELTAVAYEGTAVRSQGRAIIPFVVDNNSAACAITNPPALTTFLLGDRVTAYVQASPGSGSITSVQFFVEGKLLTATNSTPYVFAFSATNYGVGQLGLQAKAFSSAGEQVLSSNLTIVILPDYDFDGLDDRWEIQNFGSITAYDGTGDPDGDGALNGNEYLADTQPTNSSSYFCVSAIRRNTNGVFSLVFISSTGRQYRVHYNEDTLTNEAMWWMGANEFPGAMGTTLWVDDGNDIPPPTNILRFYRIGAHRP